uniref:Uncharacterized protein n=1 Tax=Caenorhabditis japonica TaxID=281687 RepID=A0A8R1J0W0_CAEJA
MQSLPPAQTDGRHFTNPSNLFRTAAMSFNIEHESLVCQLYHRTKHNSSVNVVCELSEEIGSPQFENEQWVVPCDITGLSAKKPKVVKIRLHPSVSQTSSSGDAALRQAACKSALKYLDLLLEESVWSRRSGQDDYLFGKQIDKIVEILAEMDKVVEIDNSTIGLSFLHNENFDELLKITSCKTLSAHLLTVITEESDHQTADMMFEKDGRSRHLARLVLDPGYLKTSEASQECVFESSKSCFTWVLARSDDDVENSPPRVSQKLECFIWIDGEEQEMVSITLVFSFVDSSSKARPFCMSAADLQKKEGRAC